MPKGDSLAFLVWYEVLFVAGPSILIMGWVWLAARHAVKRNRAPLPSKGMSGVHE